MTKKVTVEAGENAWCEGRNGLRAIGALEVWAGSKEMKLVFFDPVTKAKKTVMRGGLAISPKAMDELAIGWLEARGLISAIKAMEFRVNARVSREKECRGKRSKKQSV